jgi:hypothetical protein
MTTPHLILLLGILGMVLSIAGGLSILVHRASRNARLHIDKTAPVPEGDGLVQWNEAATLTLLSHKSLGRLGRIFSETFLPRTEMKDVLPIIDPVDGTAFQEGEPIIRCACGTNYHQHSWQWLVEKMNAKCVNCKRPAITQKVPC